MDAEAAEKQTPFVSASATNQGVQSAYLPQLDGIRAFAIALVLVLHFITPIPFGGEVGVDVFFVLSGYLITSILLREESRGEGIRLKRFYVRRLIRLYPPLLLVVVVLLVPALLIAPSTLKVVADIFLAVSYTTPIALTFAPGASVLWRHTWSLGVEEIFYLIWPMVLVIFLRLRIGLRVRLVVVISASLVLFVGQILVSVQGGSLQPLLRSAGLLVGCAVALWLFAHFRAVPARIGWAGVALIALAVALPPHFQSGVWAVFLAVLGSALLIAHCVTAPNSRLVSALSARPLAYVGRASYELYLWHYPLLVLLAWAFGTDFVGVSWLAAPLSITLALGAHAIVHPALARLKARLPY